jgi:hypothetical protein
MEAVSSDKQVFSERPSAGHSVICDQCLVQGRPIAPGLTRNRWNAEDTRAGRSGFVAIEAALAEFHIDARYDGDLHRADMAWTRHAAAMGLSASESQAAIMEARDLAKKRSAERQREYRKTSARVC